MGMEGKQKIWPLNIMEGGLCPSIMRFSDRNHHSSVQLTLIIYPLIKRKVIFFCKKEHGVINIFTISKTSSFSS